MASNLGQTPVRTEFQSGPTRSIFVRSFPFNYAIFCSNQALNIVCAVYTVVYQRTAHPPYVTADDRPFTV